MFIHVQLQLPAAQVQKTSYSLFNSWHNSIFGNKLRTTEDENSEKVKNSQPQLRIY